MKLIIASDIHGSAYYCKKLLERFEEEKAERMLVLGDILYHGPRNDLPRDYAPKSVIAMLNPLADKLFCVKGNCESEVDGMVLDFPVLSDTALFFDGKTTFLLSHGHHLPDGRCIPKGTILASGHTHVPLCEEKGHYLHINPGSVSIPKENSPHSYMTFDGSVLLWKDVETGEVYKECIIHNA